MHILLVEDDRTIRTIVEEALAEEGYEVSSARHGAAALAELRQGRPDLILLNLAMPVMDGWDFARRYHATPPPHAPIIILSAMARAPQHAAALGATGVLGKPFDLDELARVIAETLRGG